MSHALQGRVIAITGATGGLGKALAQATLVAGAELILIGRHPARLQALHGQLEAQHPGRSRMAVLDLEKALAKDYDDLAAALMTHYGRLDGLVHAAGILGTLTPIEHYDVPTWCKVMHVNVTAAFALTQVLLPCLRRSTDASIIFCSSSVGRRGRAHWGAYAVSKFALEGLMQVLADETSNADNLRVNAINPGPARTTMRRQAYPSEDIGRLPEPQALVAPFIKLLGPEGRGIHGQSLDAQALAVPALSVGSSNRDNSGS